MSYRRSLEDLMIGSFSGGGKADNKQTPPAPVKEQPPHHTNEYDRASS